MKKYFIFVSIIIVSILSLSGCSSTGEKSEDEIIDDLNLDACTYLHIEVYDLTITKLDIEKRMTDEDERYDTVYAYVYATTQYADISCHCTIYYALYNDGWHIENVVNNDEPEVCPKDLPSSYADDYMSTNYSLYSYSLISETYNESKTNVEYVYDLSKDNETATISGTVNLSFSFNYESYVWSEGYDVFTTETVTPKDTIQSKVEAFLEEHAEIEFSSFQFIDAEYDSKEDCFILEYSLIYENLYANEYYKLFLIANTDDKGEYTNFSKSDYYSDGHEWKDLTGTYRCTKKDCEGCFVEWNESTIHSVYSVDGLFSHYAKKDCEGCFIERNELTIRSIDFDEHDDWLGGHHSGYINFSVKYSVNSDVGTTGLAEYTDETNSFTDYDDSGISMYSYDAGNITVNIGFDEITFEHSGRTCMLEKVE